MFSFPALMESGSFCHKNNNNNNNKFKYTCTTISTTIITNENYY